MRRTSGILGGMREASLSFLVRKGKQAEAFARPGPKGGRIVYASRIPPRPLEAWRLGGFEAWKGLEA